MIGRYKSVLLVLFGVLALSAVVAASASAEATVPEWLVSGAKVIAAGEEVTAEGELLLEDMTAPGGAVDILCSGFLDGLVFPGGIDRIDEALALDKVTKNEIVCSFILPGACEPGMAPVVVPENLPWKTELILDEPGVGNLVVNLIKKETGIEGLPAYLVNCLVSGITIDDLCEGESSFDVVNNVGAGDVEGTFSHTDALVTGPAATCSLGGAGAGLIGSEDATGVVVPSLITLISGLTLSISEDGL